MAQIAKTNSKAEIKSPSEKMYNFLKYNMTKFTSVNPQIVKRSELIEGEEGQVGNVILYEYVMGKATTTKMKAIRINDEEKSITWEAVEGEVLQVLPGFKSTATTTEGFVEWTIEHEKAPESIPSIADNYANFSANIIKALDAYLLAH